MSCRCYAIERFIRQVDANKKIILVLNKIGVASASSPVQCLQCRMVAELVADLNVNCVGSYIKQAPVNTWTIICRSGPHNSRKAMVEVFEGGTSCSCL